MNAYFDKGLNRFTTGDIDWVNDTICIAGVDVNVYAPSLTSDEFLSVFPEIIASKQFTGCVTSRGDMYVQDVELPAVNTGKTINALVIYKNTGNPSNSPLIALITDSTGLPVLTNGQTIPISWSATNGVILTLRG